MGVTGSSLGSQNKIRHSAHCQKQLMQVPVLGALRISIISKLKAFKLVHVGLFTCVCLDILTSNRMADWAMSVTY